MSFLGGPECSTAANPLNQFSKYTQDEMIFQRDRMIARPETRMQGMRTTGSKDLIGSQDEMINDFRTQKNQILPETFSAAHSSQQESYIQLAPLPIQSNRWLQEFSRGANTQTQEEAKLQSQAMSFSLSDYSHFQQLNNGSSQIAGSLGQQMENTFLSSRGSPMNSGQGLSRIGMEYMSRSRFQPQFGFQVDQNIGKGKAKMIELDDENWEEQFKQIDLESSLRETEDFRVAEADTDQVDQNKLESERSDFGDFESIWRGIQAETSAAIEMENKIETHSDNIERWGDLGPFGMPFHSPQLGEYMFEENNFFKDILNPYEEGVRIIEDGGNLSLAALAFEAAVQRDPSHVDAWVMLGSAQAQNEKEIAAIRALEQGLKIDPTNLTALMSLAICYTNEGYDCTSYRTLEQWLSLKYPSLVDPNNTLPSKSEIGFTDRSNYHEKVTNLFIQAAQLSPDGEHMDPDVQVGLGVLFYGVEEYEKAVDCFLAALASTESGTSNKKDQLHLLWNRLGATLANSGRSEEAIVAYDKALTLRANFVRARYNLGVSCINIGCYEEAASHLLGSLVMHKFVEKEGRQKARDILDGGSNTLSESELEDMINQNQSDNLYDTLRRVFNLMERRDLAERVRADMEIESFRSEFDF
ncbi:Peroxisomal targeting signal receptor [Golovinomyces cichoracearum]|uniref:Peroxisomal targeting signal receptor n=1 Tax=Golovinomyces cichoracearum TaxID=62708 RepID=A0A420IG31_9PEZI|nr:Peroxisomal targeting signal receptor [Golovinomyces cichoracearum]